MSDLLALGITESKLCYIEIHYEVLNASKKMSDLKATNESKMMGSKDGQIPYFLFTRGASGYRTPCLVSCSETLLRNPASSLKTLLLYPAVLSALFFQGKGKEVGETEGS